MKAIKRWGKWIILVLVCIELASLVQYGFAETQETEPVFFSALKDVPVMPGLTELEGQSFSFDKPEGEITEVVAMMDGIGEEKVIFFYQATLPQFGWRKINETKFFRQNEYLEISFEKNQDEKLVKIMIRPTR